MELYEKNKNNEKTLLLKLIKTWPWFINLEVSDQDQALPWSESGYRKLQFMDTDRKQAV